MERSSRLVTGDNVRGAPDLVVEVLSESTADRDLGVKLQVYAPYGVRLYRVVDPLAESVRVFASEPGGCRGSPRLHGDGRLDCPLFPDIVLAVSELFAD